MSYQPSLGHRLRDLRVQDPYMNLREAAKRLGVSFVHLSQVENDRVKPTESFLAAASQLYGPGRYGELVLLLAGWTEAPPIDMSKNICHKRW